MREVEYIDAPSDESTQTKVTVMLAGGDADPDVIFIKDTENPGFHEATRDRLLNPG